MTSKAPMPPVALIPAGLAIVASTYGLARYTYGLFVPEIQAEFGLSVDVMGLIGSGSYAGYLVATLLGSAISGIVGPRAPIVLGGLAATVGMSLIALAQDPFLLAAGIVLAGTSPGLAYPPLSDAVMMLIAAPKQNRTYAVINSGTSIGVIIAGPAALLTTGDWRWAWAGFAAFACLGTIWNAVLMPAEPYRHGGGTAMPRLHWRWFIGESSARLFAAATIFGVVTAVYWTFAVDLLVRGGTLFRDHATLFWVLIGAFGLLGAAAGDLVSRFGLRRTFRGALLLIVAAIGALALFFDHRFAAYASAPVFGATFILITGLFGIWSVNVFYDRPAAGFGATFFLISVGQLLGPAIAGAVAASFSLAVAFQLAAAVGCVTVLLAPRRDLFSMARREGTNGEKSADQGAPAE